MGTKSLKLSEVENCCGAFLVVNFDYFKPIQLSDYSQFNRVQYNITEEALKARNLLEGRETPEEYRKGMTARIQGWIKEWKGKKPYLLAWLNTQQIKDGAEDVLFDLGFEVLIPKMYNENGGTAITGYIFWLRSKPEGMSSCTIEKKKAGTSIFGKVV